MAGLRENKIVECLQLVSVSAQLRANYRLPCAARRFSQAFRLQEPTCHLRENKDARVEDWESGKVEEWQSGRMEEQESGRKCFSNSYQFATPLQTIVPSVWRERVESEEGE